MEEKNLLKISLAKDTKKSVHEHILDGIKVIEILYDFIKNKKMGRNVAVPVEIDEKILELRES